VTGLATPEGAIFHDRSLVQEAGVAAVDAERHVAEADRKFIRDPGD
jgi:hypothetical protein